MPLHLMLQTVSEVAGADQAVHKAVLSPPMANVVGTFDLQCEAWKHLRFSNLEIQCWLHIVITKLLTSRFKHSESLTNQQQERLPICATAD
jgi:hypothetical protein